VDVLVIGTYYPDGFATHIAGTFEDMGHTAHRYRAGMTHEGGEGIFRTFWRKAKSRLHSIGEENAAYRSWWWGSLWQLLEEHDIDLTIVCHDSFLWPEEVERIQRKTCGPVALWFPDHIGNLTRGYCVTAPYDALFFKDPFIVEQLRDLCQGEVYHLPQCFSRDGHRLPESTTEEDLVPYRCEITTAGNLHSYRVGLFRQLTDYNVKLWGNPSPRWMDAGPVQDMFQNRYVTYGEKAKAFRAARIVINNQHPAEVWGVNKRTFEAAGIGALQLVTWRPGLDQLFSVGEEIVAYRGIDDLKKKIDYYLEHDTEREKIANRSKERAREDHTYHHRLNLMVDTVREKENGYPFPSDVRRSTQRKF